MQIDVKAEFLTAYDRHANAIYRHCFFRVFSKPLAEELTQETFLRTWQYLEKGKQVKNLRAFLYRVASNLIIDHARKKKEERLDVLLENSAEAEPAYDGRSELETAELAREAIRVMQMLRKEDREILTLRYLDQLELKEIADLFGITANNVSVRLNRAMHALRQLLPENHESR